METIGWTSARSLNFLSEPFQCRRISGLTLPPAMKGDPFQPLRSENSPDPCPAKGAPVLAFDHGESDEVLSRRTDDHGPGFSLSYFLENTLFSFVSFFSPEPPGGVKDHILVADFEKDGILRSSLNNNGVITGAAEIVGDLSPGVRFGIDSCLGRFGKNRITACPVERGVRKGAQSKDKPVPGRERIDPGPILPEKEIGAQALSSEIGLKDRIRNRLNLRRLLREIDPEKPVEKPFHGSYYNPPVYSVHPSGRANPGLHPHLFLARSPVLV